MPIGTGAVKWSNLPDVEFVSDAPAFFEMTSKNTATKKTHGAPGPGQFVEDDLPKSGLLSKLQITFVGSLTVATAAVTTSDEWPYNLMDDFKLNLNGQSSLWSADGCDLHALRFVRYPAYREFVDQFPDVVGGGGSVAVGTFPLSITWEIPVAVDDTTLIGSLYLQSPNSTVSYRISQALNSKLFSANPNNATIAGTFYVLETTFDIPRDANNKVVVPDLSRLHGFNAVPVPFTATGESPAEIIRSAGQLHRLFTSIRSSNTNRLSALPSAATSRKIDALKIEYGLNQNPFDFTPASTLLTINGQHYGAPAPYDRLVLDQVRENPRRDMINLQGVTELNVVPTINSAVSITSSQARVRVVQETLF